MIEEEIDEVIQGTHGFAIGFQMGLYKIDTVEDVDTRCLNEQAEEKILGLYEAVFGGKVRRIFVFSDLFALIV